MNIGVYAGSLRPGGGLTALKQVLGGLLELPSVQVTVFTGAEDGSRALQPTLQGESRLSEVRFHPQAGAFRRYLASKRAFRNCDFDWLISINYHIPTRAKLLVYHLNLLSFEAGPNESWGARIKRWDARRACRKADLNLFESRYLLEKAEQAVGSSTRSPGLLYLGVHEDFFRDVPSREFAAGELLMVSSMQPHKDNGTALRALAELQKRRPDVDWRLSIAGGQSAEQWQPLLNEADGLGVRESVHLLGPLDKPTLSSRMAHSACLINPSHIESFCMVALEAMASHCPAVVTNATSMPESVGDAALVVPAGDAAAFADAVLRLHDSPDLRERLLKTGSKRAREFRPAKFREALREFLGS